MLRCKKLRIENVENPINKQDVVNLESLTKCLSLNDKYFYFDSKNKIISNVTSSKFSTDVDLYTLTYYVTNRISNTAETFNRSFKK